ncbi:hypothetical protein GGR54DRAFT_640935 [Hypoxylon sp. NC1633]|nr:hypothetical protein GGR54DRAFT_640935 [Hypoxylon sp. NC1633]
MAAGYSSRSVADATRFTPNTPHANAKAATNPSSSASSAPSPTSPTSQLPRPGMPRPPAPESMEERVRRLRAAHLAAKRHQTSRFDRVVDASRGYFDAAHKITVLGMIAVSGLALFVGVYATVDMMLYNKKRRNEFFALQKQLRADGLEAARLAYMTGTASAEQTALVEKAEERARQSGVSLPPLLSSPRSAPSQPPTAPLPEAERSAWPGEALAESSLSAADEAWRERDQEPAKSKGVLGWLFGGLKKEEAGDGTLDFEREAAAASGVRKTVDDSQHALRDKAKAAFDQERENQRRGGPLDQVGLDGKTGSAEGGSGSKSDEKKRGWGWW